MTASTFQSLDIAPFWSRMSDSLVRLVDYIPDDKLNWSPKPELWNFKGILIHICGVRHGWIAGRADPGSWDAIIRDAQTKEGIKRHLASSWETVAGFVSSPDKLAAKYDDGGSLDQYPDGGTKVTGHWIAYHLLEHDIHHRADIFHYLALLDIETPDVGTP